ncbi:S-layer homology domain-containing protein [Lysinibacillus sp. 54212]|uniref:S-layer homology domain-containing protein n=1 Tax=Lysinibacillus sp. 54212 TaxID=3119829 RepID=UPI002FC82727
MNKKLFLSTLVASSVIVAAHTVFANDFTDVDHHTEMGKAIQSLVDRGIVNGYGDGTFRPNNVVTRGHAAIILAGVLKLDTANATAHFTDVPTTHKNYRVISALAQRGIINGHSDGSFRPNDPITREQMAIILARAFKLKAENIDLPFTDVKKGSASYTYVSALYYNGITSGITATTFDLNSAVTRGHLAVFIARVEALTNVSNSLNIIAENYGFLQFTDNQSEAGVYKIIGNKDQIKLLPLAVGTSKLLLAGPSLASTVQQKKYELYNVHVEKINGKLSLRVEQLDLLENLTHNAQYYLNKDLALPFIPTTATVQDQFGQTVNSSLYKIARDDQGIELAFFSPGQYTLQLSNGDRKKEYIVHVSIANFETVIRLSVSS